MSAALGFSQMNRLNDLLNARQQVADWYAAYLAEVDEIELPIVLNSTNRMSWFVYVMRVSKNIDREAFAKLLISKGVPVRPYFSPIHLQPFMKTMFGYDIGDYPVTEDLGLRSLAIPFSGNMSEEEVAFVSRTIKEQISATKISR